MPLSLTVFLIKIKTYQYSVVKEHIAAIIHCIIQNAEVN